MSDGIEKVPIGEGAFPKRRSLLLASVFALPTWRSFFVRIKFERLFLRFVCDRVFVRCQLTRFEQRGPCAARTGKHQEDTLRCYFFSAESST